MTSINVEVENNVIIEPRNGAAKNVSTKKKTSDGAR